MSPHVARTELIMKMSVSVHSLRTNVAQRICDCTTWHHNFPPFILKQHIQETLCQHIAVVGSALWIFPFFLTPRGRHRSRLSSMRWRTWLSTSCEDRRARQRLVKGHEQELLLKDELLNSPCQPSLTPTYREQPHTRQPQLVSASQTCWFHSQQSISWMAHAHTLTFIESLRPLYVFHSAGVDEFLVQGWVSVPGTIPYSNPRNWWAWCLCSELLYLPCSSSGDPILPLGISVEIHGCI